VGGATAVSAAETVGEVAEEVGEMFFFFGVIRGGEVRNGEPLPAFSTVVVFP
jgi:hypothetical protein